MKNILWRAFSVIVSTAFAACSAGPGAVPTTPAVPTGTAVPTSTAVADGITVPAGTSTFEPREGVMPVQVTVQVSTDVGRALRQRSPPSGESQELLSIAESFGLRLEPMHGDTEDSNLQSYFIAVAPDRATAERFVARLQETGVVVSAYLQPLVGLP